MTTQARATHPPVPLAQPLTWPRSHGQDGEEQQDCPHLWCRLGAVGAPVLRRPYRHGLGGGGQSASQRHSAGLCASVSPGWEPAPPCLAHAHQPGCPWALPLLPPRQRSALRNGAQWLPGPAVAAAAPPSLPPSLLCLRGSCSRAAVCFWVTLSLTCHPLPHPPLPTITIPCLCPCIPPIVPSIELQPVPGALWVPVGAQGRGGRKSRCWSYPSGSGLRVAAWDVEGP